MARLPDILGTLDPAAQKVYERIAAKRGKIRGPYVPLMHHPALAERVADLGEYLRFDATLPGDIRELAILITARAATWPHCRRATCGPREWCSTSSLASRCPSRSRMRSSRRWG